MNLRGILRSTAPSVVLEIVRARRDLAANHGSSPLFSWLSACSPRVRSAIERSRLSLLPLSLRRPLSFVIDVGANEGQWISSLLSLLRVQEVWVFEPNPEAMEKCRRHVGHYPGVDFKEMALGAAADAAVLHITKSSDFSSLLQPNDTLIRANYRNDPAQVVAERTVRLAPLDDLVPPDKHVDLLKIDVQGAERAVLRGAAGTLRNTTAVLMEVNFKSHYKGDETFGPLHALMAGAGFELWSISPPYHAPSGEVLWADALFVNQDCPEAGKHRTT